METMKYFGIVEGFYGKTWSFQQRNKLLDDFKQWKFNTYVYAPKFDLKHRLEWQHPYSSDEMDQFKDLVNKSNRAGISFIFSISPGLNYHVNAKENLKMLLRKLKTFKQIGVTHYAILMDDIPTEIADGNEHAQIVKVLTEELCDAKNLMFCPTIYSNWHLSQSEDAQNYLKIIGDQIHPDVSFFWTGPTIVSKTIHPDDFKSINSILNRNVILWDNFFANDYVPANTIFTGPIMNRPPELLDLCNGHLLNPSNSFLMNYLSFSTFSDYISMKGRYNPHESWEYHVEKKFPKHSKLMKLILGYFYTPLSNSPQWESIFDTIRNGLEQNNSNLLNMENLIIDIIKSLHEDFLLKDLEGWWEELYPFVQTLYGDLDYTLRVIRLTREFPNEKNLAFSLRDPRWTTPLDRLMQTIYRNFAS